MPDDPKLYPDEEYHFSEDDRANPLNPDESVFSETEIPLEQKDTQLNKARRYTFLVIGLVALIIIVYKLLGVFFAPDKASQDFQPVDQKLPSITNVKPAVTQQPEPSKLRETITSFNTQKQSDERLAKIEVKSNAMDSRIDSLLQTVESLKSTVSTMNTEVNRLNENIAGLTQKMEMQAAQLSQFQKKPVPKRVVVRSRPIQRPVYFIQAIVPGRAWLKTTNGATITVGQGTSVPGYGKVAVIDPQQGQVLMSSGKVIEYSPDDQ